MTAYASVDDVKGVRPVVLNDAPTATVEMMITGIEATIHSVMAGQGYPTIPATGGRDVAMIQQQVIQEAAALTYMATRTSDDLPEWVTVWHNAYTEWLRALRKGEIRLLDQTPEIPGKAVKVHRLRTLPKVAK